jgi:outer membrane protein OmpA-like peptidoglycan-associated protein
MVQRSRSANAISSQRGLLCFLLLILLSLPLAAAETLEAEVYMAGVHESTWQFSGSSAICELKHEIPQFGLARFYRLTGEELGFDITSYQPVPEQVEAVLREASPEWEHAPPDPLEQMVVVASGLKPITLDRRPAGWLLSSLAKGQIGSFDLLDWNDSRKQMQIRLSPVNFQRPYRAFKRCLTQLSSKGFESIRQTTVHFSLDAHSLDEASRERLRELADYIKADSDITAVRIAGHADDQGEKSYNLRLSARRAKSVQEELIHLGVKSSLLSSRHYGESRPKLRGRTERARAANRRVEIELAH